MGDLDHSHEKSEKKKKKRTDIRKWERRGIWWKAEGDGEEG